MESKYEALAEANHEIWLADRKKTHGEEPREKTINNKTFNIAVDWENLDPLWKKEQIEASRIYIDTFEGKQFENLEQAADMVHQIWMKNNPWAEKGASHLWVAYSELPEDEKEKDRVVAKNIMEIFGIPTNIAWRVI